MSDNRRVLSVQIGDSTKQELYYADASTGDRSLFQVPVRVGRLASQGCIFAGYNIKAFEVNFLRKFLGVRIQDTSVVDLREMDAVKKLQEKTGKAFLELEEVCSAYGISTDHRRLLDEKVELLKKKPEILAQANEAAKQLEAKGWTPDSSLKSALDRIATGNAVLESYQEFVQKNGAEDSVFYKYAVGDVICEHRLLQALQQGTASPQAQRV